MGDGFHDFGLSDRHVLQRDECKSTGGGQHGNTQDKDKNFHQIRFPLLGEVQAMVATLKQRPGDFNAPEGPRVVFSRVIGHKTAS
jgi:hypothetical protein